MFDKNGLATKTHKAHVYNYNSEGEFNGSSYLQIEIGTGIPAQSTLIRPNDRKDGFTQVFNEKKQEWQYIEDHRYDEVYNIETKQKEDVRYLGKLKSEHTLIAPPSTNHEFVNGEWVITEEKQIALDELKKQQKVSELEERKNSLSTDMNMHLLLDEKEEAKAIAQQIKDINSEIEKLKE